MDNTVLGIDVGSVSIGMAELSPEGAVVRSAYAFHRGHVRETIEGMLPGFGLGAVTNIAATTSTPDMVQACMRVDNRVATIRSARRFQKAARALLHVGGEQFFLVHFDAKGDYRTCRSNTSCAAGTGGFLDQQAGRLGLGGSAELSMIALQNTGPIPKIASRCSVFAKTDLIHAQQEGYSLAQITDGLCLGLAKNIVDTLFRHEDIPARIVLSGGVSLNRAVLKHLSSILATEIVVDPVSHLFGAVGAALCMLDETGRIPARQCTGIPDILTTGSSEKSSAYPPLELRLSEYPDFDSGERYEYLLPEGRVPGMVEVDIYEDLSTATVHDVYLGIDIGSTSTKAVFVDMGGRVLAGFYTRTAGRPIDAVRALFECMDRMAADRAVRFAVKGAGTTGSGRKLVGRLIGADLVLDEITAHARAACELNADVDTIIEIGGQDSKFTTLKDSLVTFSAMNAVCAAGTGSFIEELSAKLSCPLSECSSRAEGKRAPMASDRCTVFMERDLNHYLSEGYAEGEVLAAALHAVCENYLTKVAVESAIGDVVFFQGATAKNRALVAAFEQRLNRPILVSRFCHLTGALGTALTLADEHRGATRFRGLDLYTKDIPVRSEVCGLCANHCKLTVADVGGEQVAYGFLCGRDYDTKTFVNNNRSGFDLFKTRRKVFSRQRPKEYRFPFVVGLPLALYLREDAGFWQCFFDELGIATVTAEPHKEDVRQGRRLAGADFCAPVHALFGQVGELLAKADYVFAPVYLEDSPPARGVRRQYCYYTQFSVSLAKAHAGRDEGRILMPLVNYLYSTIQTKVRLYRALRPLTGGQVSLMDVARAFEKAQAFRQQCRQGLQEAYRRERPGEGDISVVLLGRPYTVLSRSMNNGIVDIFASLGIKTFFQDM
ncbi:MAG TPA: acyl-CoA dehydratase activase, partial [Deltaproteobacteria bacterium]|nr:acyl-CoA dehydratase activase [Deltaproteobacteria bacterium]